MKQCSKKQENIICGEQRLWSLTSFENLKAVEVIIFIYVAMLSKQFHILRLYREEYS
jgi:hypothetical protein